MKHILLLLIFISLYGFVKAQNAPSEGKEVIIPEVSETPIPKEEPLIIVETMPEFPGGEQKLMEFLYSNIKYPESAKKNGYSGTAYVTYVIEKDGSLSDIRILRGVANAPECDQEAVRVIKMMPNWKPGFHRGKPVRVQFNLPIKFTLR